MQRFSITQLENARNNPTAFAKQLKSGENSKGGFGYPKSLRWLNAITKYHIRNDISDAILSIEEGFAGRKDTAKNRKELEQFIEALGIYEMTIKERKYSFIKSRESVSIQVNPQLRISGKIPIIYMKPEAGFAAYFVSQNYPSWESELRFPVIQNYVANNVFMSELEGIDVGYIDYYSGSFHETSYSKIHINQALTELKSIGQTISKNLK